MDGSSVELSSSDDESKSISRFRGGFECLKDRSSKFNTSRSRSTFGFGKKMITPEDIKTPETGSIRYWIKNEMHVRHSDGKEKVYHPKAGIICMTPDRFAVLMVHNRSMYKKTEDSTYCVWSFPRGHSEGEEQPIDTATREFKEETGYDIEITNVKQFIKVNNVMYYICFETDILSSPTSGKIIDTNEILQTKWIACEDIECGLYELTGEAKFTFSKLKKYWEEVDSGIDPHRRHDEIPPIEFSYIKRV